MDRLSTLTPELACDDPDREAGSARSRRRDDGLPGVIRGATTKRSRKLQSEAGHHRRALGLGCALVAIGLVACGNKADTPAGPLPSRTDGAKVTPAQTATTDAFCDRHTTDDNAAAFRWPELAPGEATPAAPTTWRWVNIWATWCEPCIEELPLLAAWRDKLAAAGKPVELAFVSVDDSDADVEAFRKAHPGMPPSLRIATADQRAAWLRGFNLSDGAIPIHLFVSPANRLRCARAGGIRDKDYAIVERLLAE